MKQLKTLHLKNARVLETSEMKRVLGGSGYTNCSTTCSDGTVLEITDCNGRCIAEDGVAVTCEGNSYNLTKSCKDSGSGATTSGIF